MIKPSTVKACSAFFLAAALFFSCGKENPSSTADQLPELPALEEVDDVCLKMNDFNFMKFCYDNYDINHDSKVSMIEAGAVREMTCDVAEDFAGIEYFSALETFASSSAVKLDLSYNSALARLRLSGSPIEEIDLSYNTALASTDSCFYDCESLKSVRWPKKLAEIGSYAFAQCPLITSCPLPDGISVIGDHSFSEAGLTSVIIPESVDSVGGYAFEKCAGLASIEINSEDVSWAGYASSGCESADSIDIKGTLGNRIFSGVDWKTVTLSGCTVKELAFCDCPNLTRATMSDCAVSGQAFSGCSKLTSATISGGSISGQVFYNCPEFESVTISDCPIGEYAFNGYTSLSEVIMGDGVTSIGNYSFGGCTELNYVGFSSDLVSIGQYAFDGCTGLANLSIGGLKKLTLIDSHAFNDTGLTVAVLPESLNELGDGAFSGCLNLTSVTVNAAVPPTLDGEFGPADVSRTLLVPEESVSLYESSDWADWFSTIRANVYYGIIPSSLEFNAEGDPLPLYQFDVNSSNAWTATCCEDWVTISPTFGSSGYTAMNVYVEKNIGYNRSAEITFTFSTPWLSPATVTVKQAGPLGSAD